MQAKITSDLFSTGFQYMLETLVKQHVKAKTSIDKACKK